MGEQITEADGRLLPTLLRFDAAHYSHFKCNKRRLRGYPGLWAYTRECYQLPGVAPRSGWTTSSCTDMAATAI